MVMDEQLRAKASSVAQRLRKAGRRVDLVLESKKMKWVFKVRQRPPISTVLCHWKCSSRSALARGMLLLDYSGWNCRVAQRHSGQLCIP